MGIAVLLRAARLLAGTRCPFSIVPVAATASSSQSQCRHPTHTVSADTRRAATSEPTNDRPDIKAVHAVFLKLRQIDNGIVRGHTTVKGEMLITVDSGGKGEELAQKINHALDDKFHVKHEVGYRAFPEKKDYDYASEQGISELAGRRADARRLRSEASQAIRDELDRGSAGASGPDARRQSRQRQSRRAQRAGGQADLAPSAPTSKESESRESQEPAH
jgi:hypothetical protein